MDISKNKSNKLDQFENSSMSTNDTEEQKREINRIISPFISLITELSIVELMRLILCIGISISITALMITRVSETGNGLLY